MNMKIKIISTLISVAALTAITGSAMAAGTLAGTAVDNTATISYDVGTVTQTPIGSSPGGNSSGAGTPTSFVVDKKIDLLVTSDVTDVGVTPGSTAAAPNNLVFTVKNEGNSTENFKLTDANAGSDDFDISACTIASATPAVAAATGPIVVELAPDAETSITVSCAVPLTPTNSQTAIVDLKAEAVTDAGGATTYAGTETDTSACSGTPDEACTVDTVLADGLAASTSDTAVRNATHAATGTYIVSTADLTVQKTQAVTSTSLDLDDSGDAAGNTDVAGSMHIPGSTVTYTITVVNDASAATADNIVLTDAVPATLDVVGTPTVVITGGDGGTASVTSADSNSVTTDPAGFSLDAGETATLTITAIVL